MPSAGCGQPRAEVTDRMLVAGPGTCTRSWMSTPCITTSIARTGAGTLRPPGADEIAPPVAVDVAAPEIRRRRVLGGLINEYERRHEEHQLMWARLSPSPRQRSNARSGALTARHTRQDAQRTLTIRRRYCPSQRCRRNRCGKDGAKPASRTISLGIFPIWRCT
jgi:hypothetical protein